MTIRKSKFMYADFYSTIVFIQKYHENDEYIEMDGIEYHEGEWSHFGTISPVGCYDENKYYVDCRLTNIWGIGRIKG